MLRSCLACPRVAVIADDLTGALDAGLQFAERGLETKVSVGLVSSEAAPIWVLNADSRNRDREAAAERMRAAARLCAGRQVFKKVDSTLRGNVGAESAALRDALGFRAALLAPAFVEAGRIVSHGRLWVHGVPVDQTPFARDPQWPAYTAEVVALASRGLEGERVELISLEAVRREHLALVACLGDCRLAVAEGETTADLAAVARAIVEAGPGILLPCGSAGLAAAWADALDLRGDYAVPWAGAHGPVLVVSGSHNTVTQGQLLELRRSSSVGWFELEGDADQGDAAAVGRQIAAALAQGRDAVLSASFGALLPGAAARVAELLGRSAGVAMAEADAIGARPAGLVLTGGDTALTVCGALDVQSLTIAHAIEPGIPGAFVAEGAWQGLPVVTKAGGFGSKQALQRALRWIKEGSAMRDDCDGA
ncbi:MAG: four-carbon acid sugar kinase family protein [Anaerolineales bacterium]